MEIISGSEFDKEKGTHLPLPVVKGKHSPSVSTIDLDISANELKELSRWSA